MTLRNALGPPHRPNSATISARRASCKSRPSSWRSSVMSVKITRFTATEVVYGVTGTDVTELPECGVSP
jgi:hypothetical protein